ncbi:MAG: uracil-DNA glycosylase family 4 [Pseudohongiellaceae bacterium]|jgi:uracil-DNA glycosylase family 4
MDPVLRRYLSSLAAAGVRRVPGGRPAAPELEVPAEIASSTSSPPELTTPRVGRVPAPPVPPLVTRPAAPKAQSAQDTLDGIAAEVRACRACQLCEQRNNAVPGEGSPQASIVFVGEGPGADEDLSGRPFVGAPGQLLEDIITKGMGLSRQDVFITNAVKCRPPNNRAPLPSESAACRGFLDRQLAALQPKVICTLGSTASQLLLQTDVAIGRLRGGSHQYGEIPVIATYHPAYLLRDPSAKRPTWDDIQKVMKIGIPS